MDSQQAELTYYSDNNHETTIEDAWRWNFHYSNVQNWTPPQTLVKLIEESNHTQVATDPDQR